MKIHGTTAQKELYKNFNSATCDDSEGNYISFDLPKISEYVSNSLAIVLLIGLQYFYWVKN